jgi:hypothetical protein
LSSRCTIRSDHKIRRNNKGRGICRALFAWACRSYFPSVLRFGFRFARFGYAASIIVMLPLQLLPSLVPSSMVALITGALSLAGVAWSWLEITRGYSVYRLQPLVAPRWGSV